ncbi:TonB-dependent receptor domain-containing protein [Thauera sp. Sel9]|uniref:TonB-dependent receptor domain-containing protein n=1 Tax=Thauera sp. Sel9 TaxID=2974299 RepID=UPI0021E188AC|nr:TonB-dependent receptor [Thauera sp. Sel9]MCV2219556.1 TonB-dependent receptor [Thauera sp. Sel9]
MDEIVVTASGFEQAIAEAPATISVITKEELEGKYYRDVTDALQDLPGISIEGGSGGKIESTSINIRGMGESYVLFLVDGKPLGASSEAYYNGFGGGAQVGWLPPMSAIERIEVVRGPMSSLYGSSALGGVINIITKKVTDSWTGSVTLDTVLQENDDAGKTYQGRFYLNGPLVNDKLALVLYGSKYKRSEDDFIGGYARKEREDITGKLRWKFSEAQSLEFETGVAEHENERTAKTGSAGDMANKRTHFSLMHDIDWNSAISTKSFILQEKVDIENGSLESAYRATTINSKTVARLERQVLTMGLEHKKEETDHDASRFPGSSSLKLSRWQAALFIEDEYYLTDDFALTGGLRYDRNQHYGNEVTPRLYGVYHLSPQLVVKGGVSGGYKTPTLKQADDRIVENAARGASWDKGNPNLKPERSTNYELGINWTDPQWFNAGLTVYRTNFEDKIGTHTICQSPSGMANCQGPDGSWRNRMSQYINLDAARLSGVEATFSMPISRAAHFNANYTWSDSEITGGASKGRPLNNTPRHMVNLGLDWKIGDHAGMWAKAKYKSKTIEDGTASIPGYTLVDIGGLYRLHKHLNTFAGIYNLFDKEVNSSDYGKTLDGRRLYLGVTAEF